MTTGLKRCEVGEYWYRADEGHRSGDNLWGHGNREVEGIVTGAGNVLELWKTAGARRVAVTGSINRGQPPGKGTGILRTVAR